MLNVSWAKKRAEFVFVFAIGGRERERERESREKQRGNLIERYKTMKIKNDGMRQNVRGIL